MGAGGRRRHEAIRLSTAAAAAGGGDYEETGGGGAMTEVDLSFDERRDYGAGPAELTMPPVESIQEALTGDAQGAVDIRYRGGPGEPTVDGDVRVGRWSGFYTVGPDELSCTCGGADCEHRRRARVALAEAVGAVGAAAPPPVWERSGVRAQRRLAADHAAAAAAAAAGRSGAPADGPGWADDPGPFQAAYNRARERIAAGEDPVPYMREGATGGLGDRDGGRAFGVEVEFDLPADWDRRRREGALEAIGRDLHTAGLTDTSDMLEYHAGRRGGYRQWSFERDSSVAGEVVSPKMHDEPATWDQLEAVCDIVRRHGGLASRSAGSHVTVSTADYGTAIANHESLIRGVREHEDLLYRLGQNTERRRHRRSLAAKPQWAPPAEGYASLPALRRGNTRNFTVNMAHVHGRADDRVEYRLWDATLRPSVIQAQINLSLGMTAAAAADYRWGPAVPIGDHYARNRERLQGRPGAGLTGARWLADTSQIRRLADRLFRRSANREQIAALYAATRWERP